MRPLKCAFVVFAVVSDRGGAIGRPSDRRYPADRAHAAARRHLCRFLRQQHGPRGEAEQNIELLLKQRPGERANLLAWQAGAALQRAVRAHDAGKPDEFTRVFPERDARASPRAAKLSTGRDGVAAITGGTYAFFADRLPQEHRAAAWAQAYDAYSVLWKQQGAQARKDAGALQGELLSGMAQSAQRTGRSDEAAQFVDRMLTCCRTRPTRRWRGSGRRIRRVPRRPT